MNTELRDEGQLSSHLKAFIEDPGFPPTVDNPGAALSHPNTLLHFGHQQSPCEPAGHAVVQPAASYAEDK